MTADRDDDPEATVQQPQPFPQSPPEFDPPEFEPEFENIDPEKTLVREDWESTVIRRVARHVAAVQSSIGEDAAAEGRFGWESEGLRRLAQELQRAGK